MSSTDSTSLLQASSGWGGKTCTVLVSTFPRVVSLLPATLPGYVCAGTVLVILEMRKDSDTKERVAATVSSIKGQIIMWNHVAFT